MEYNITPSLGFIYQVTHPSNQKYIPDLFQQLIYESDFEVFNFNYQDALDCSKDIDTLKWQKVYDFLKLFDNPEIIKKIGYEIDKDFLIDVFKREVIELQNGRITLLHSRNIGFLLFDIIAQIITGSYEGYRPKCKRDDKNPDENALSIYDKLKFDSYYTDILMGKGFVGDIKFKDLDFRELDEEKQGLEKFTPEKLEEIYEIRRNDHTDDIRTRIISTNITIFNNAFYTGESTLEFLFSIWGGVGNTDLLIKNLNLSKETTNKLKSLSLELSVKQFKNILVIYSFPFDKLDKYVYLSYPFGYKIKNKQNINQFFKEYLSKEPWLKKFQENYLTQTRIIDLCYTKYGYEDGVKISKIIDMDDKNLNYYLNKLENIVFTDKDLIKKIEQNLDQPKIKKTNPIKSIKSVPPKQKKKLYDQKQLESFILNYTENQIPRIKEFEEILLENGELDLLIFYLLKLESFDIIKDNLPHLIEALKKFNYKIGKEKHKSFDKLLFQYILEYGMWDENIRKYNQNYASYLSSLAYDYAEKYGRNEITDELVVGGTFNWNVEEYIQRFWKTLNEEDKNKLKDFIKKSNDARLIYNYIYYILGKRWQEIENKFVRIANGNLLENYIRIFMKKRWIEAEDTLMKDPDGNGAYYAIHFFGKRWLDMEPYLYKFRNTEMGSQSLENYLEVFGISEDDLVKEI